MRNRRGALLVMLCLCAPAALRAETIFRDGFETPCSVLDEDLDRLTACEEDLALTDPLDADTDDDGLRNGDEVLGTLDGLDLPSLGVNPRHKDLLIEYDWFENSSEQGTSALCPLGTHSHRPTPEVLDIVTTMFAKAPVANPDGKDGIQVIHDYGQGGLFTGGSVVADPDGDGILQGHIYQPDFDAHYATHFAPNRVTYFRYVLMPHRWRRQAGNDTFAGIAEVAGTGLCDEMIVSLYCLRSTRNVGSSPTSWATTSASAMAATATAT